MFSLFFFFFLSPVCISENVEFFCAHYKFKLRVNQFLIAEPVSDYTERTVNSVHYNIATVLDSVFYTERAERLRWFCQLSEFSQQKRCPQKMIRSLLSVSLGFFSCSKSKLNLLTTLICDHKLTLLNVHNMLIQYNWFQSLLRQSRILVCIEEGIPVCSSRNSHSNLHCEISSWNWDSSLS